MASQQNEYSSAINSFTLKEKVDKSPKLMVGKYEFDFDPLEPEDEFKTMAVQELRETPENIEEGLKTLRELLKGWFH